MSYGARIDDNQPEICVALREAGAQVECLSDHGKGVPDLLVVAPDGRTLLVEVKDGNKPPSARELTKAQVKFHARWKGELHVVTCPEEARACLVRKP